MNKTCLIINFWLGNRRRFPLIYDKDKLIFLKQQIIFLEKYKNNVDTIFFNFNVDKEHYELLSKAINITPKKIGNSEIKINIRENYDFSYGAWNEITKKEIENYDYFIFNEDDYVFTQNNWDDYLVKKFNSKDNMGYLGMAVRELHIYPEVKKILGYENYETVRESFHSVGITSSDNLKLLFNKKGNLIEENKSNSYNTEKGRIELTQTRWSAQYYEIGKENFDVRNEYQVDFQLTDRKEDIWRLFHWNEEKIMMSLRTVLQPNHTWYMCYDYDYQKQKEYE